MRALPVALAAALVLALPAAAEAEYSPTIDLDFNTYAPGVAPAVTAVMQQDLGEETTQLIAARFPSAVTLNPNFSVSRCSTADANAGACPAASSLGRVNITSPLGTATGTVHLTEDFRLVALLQAAGGVYRPRIYGRIVALPDGSPEITFDRLPQFPITESRLALDGGRRGLFLNPRDCGTYQVAARFVSASGVEVRHSLPLRIRGCPEPPAISNARVRPRRQLEGRRLRLRWSVSPAGARTIVRLYRREKGVWRALGRRRAPAAQANKLRIGRSWKGKRLEPGRYRLALRAVAADGGLSRRAWARFRIVPAP